MAVLFRSSRPRVQKWSALKYVMVSLLEIDHARRDRSNTLYVITEGMVQRTFLLLVDGDRVKAEQDLSRFVRLAPFGDVLVHVAVTADEAIARLDSRERGTPPRLASLDARILAARLTEGDALMGRVAYATGMPVVEHDPGIDARETAQRVADLAREAGSLSEGAS
jgi:hypothetical protein